MINLHLFFLKTKRTRYSLSVAYGVDVHDRSESRCNVMFDDQLSQASHVFAPIVNCEHMISIVVVEDENDLREEVVFGLSQDKEFNVAGVADSNGLYRHLLRSAADVVLLDVGLPNDDGFEITRQLRSMSQTKGIGIIMLTGQVGKEYRVQGLECGADAYLAKPVNMAEVSAQIRSLMRRLRLPEERHFTNSWKYRHNEWKLIAPSGCEIELTHLEASFIDLLVRNAGRPVKRKEIIFNAFGQDPLQYDERRLEAIVSRLRKKIRIQCPLVQPIRVAHSFGYLFSEPVEYI